MTMNDSPRKYSVLLVDDHEMIIEGIKSILKGHTDYQVIGQAGDGESAVKKASTLKPDIVTMDLSMPGLNGIEATKKLKAANPDLKIVVYTMFSDREMIVELFKAGISAYITKDGPTGELIQAFRAVTHGATYFKDVATEAATNFMKRKDQTCSLLSRLSPREHEVFHLLAEGWTIKNIAEKLCLHRKTVETHKYHILEKLQVDCLADLTKIAMKHNLIQD